MSTNNSYTVQGMTCSSCGTKVSSAVRQVPGVTDTEVDIVTGTLTVAGADLDDAAVRSAITDAGYQLG